MMLKSRFGVFALLLGASLFFNLSEAQAQKPRTKEIEMEDEGKPAKKTTKKKSKKEEEDRSFKNRLWYGGGFGLGFSGWNGGSVFSFGLSPMVGYKIWGPFSAGPRVAVTFNSVKVPGEKALNLFDYEAGIFARGKIWGPIFAHAEVANAWAQFPWYDNSGELTKLTDQTVNQYFGLGYNNSEGGVGTEILILYNPRIAADPNSPYNPWDFRFGFTWKF